MSAVRVIAALLAALGTGGACDTCGEGVRRQVRAGIAADGVATAGAVLLPLAVLALAVALIHLWPRRRGGDAP